MTKVISSFGANKMPSHGETGSRKTLTEQKIQQNLERLRPCVAGVRLTRRTLGLIKSSEPGFDGSDHVRGNRTVPEAGLLQM